MNIFIKKYRICFFLFSLTILNSSFTYAVPQLPDSIKRGKPVLSLGAGASITSSLGNSQSFPFNQPLLDTSFQYSSNSASQVEPIFDIFFGGEWKMSPKSALQLGLGYNQTVPFQITGTFQQGILPSISQINNNYRYEARLRQILVESKWEYLLGNRFRPYIFAGLGAAINTASNYVAYVPFPNVTREYENNTQTNFSYGVGLGIDVDIIEQVRFGMGYRFSDFGQVKLGQANIFGNNVSGSLSQSHFYTNEVLTQLTFIF